MMGFFWYTGQSIVGIQVPASVLLLTNLVEIMIDFFFQAQLYSVLFRKAAETSYVA